MQTHEAVALINLFLDANYDEPQALQLKGLDIIEEIIKDSGRRILL